MCTFAVENKNHYNMPNSHRNNTVEIADGKIRFDVDVYVFKEQDHLAAYCPSLDLASTGTDFQDAVKNFYECLQLHVECCSEMGTFEEDLREHGWKVGAKKVVPPTFRAQLKRPQLSQLMQSGINYERISAPVRIPAFA